MRQRIALLLLALWIALSAGCATIKDACARYLSPLVCADIAEAVEAGEES